MPTKPSDMFKRSIERREQPCLKPDSPSEFTKENPSEKVLQQVYGESAAANYGVLYDTGMTLAQSKWSLLRRFMKKEMRSIPKNGTTTSWNYPRIRIRSDHLLSCRIDSSILFSSGTRIHLSILWRRNFDGVGLVRGPPNLHGRLRGMLQTNRGQLYRRG